MSGMHYNFFPGLATYLRQLPLRVYRINHVSYIQSSLYDLTRLFTCGWNILFAGLCISPEQSLDLPQEWSLENVSPRLPRPTLAT